MAREKREVFTLLSFFLPFFYYCGTFDWNKIKEHKPGCGRGIGAALYNHGGAFTGNGKQAIIKGHARLTKTGDKVEVFVGSTEMGQGFRTTLRKICAATLGISMDNIEYKPLRWWIPAPPPFLGLRWSWAVWWSGPHWR